MNKSFIIIFISLTILNSQVKAVAFIDRTKCAFQLCKQQQFECSITEGCINRIQIFERCQIEKTSFLTDCLPYGSVTALSFAQCLQDYCGYQSINKVKDAENRFINCNNDRNCTASYDLYTNRTNQLYNCYNSAASNCLNNSTINSLPYHNCAYKGYFQCDETITPYRLLPDGNPAKEYQLFSYASTVYDWTKGKLLKFSFGILMAGLSILLI